MNFCISVSCVPLTVSRKSQLNNYSLFGCRITVSMPCVVSNFQYLAVLPNHILISYSSTTTPSRIFQTSNFSNKLMVYQQYLVFAVFAASALQSACAVNHVSQTLNFLPPSANAFSAVFLLLWQKNFTCDSLFSLQVFTPHRSQSW